MNYPVPEREAERLQELKAFRVVGTAPETEFDHIVRLASSVFRAPTALISFVDKDHQFFKARVGFDACETSRDVSFCAHALVGDGLLVIPDARLDARFAHNPLVTGSPSIRFYAGAALKTRRGNSIGSICIIDTKPRSGLTDHECGLLRSLARVTMDTLERRRLDTMERATLHMAAAIPDAIVCTDEDGFISFWNYAAEAKFGFTRTEAMGRHISIITPPERRQAQAALWAQILAGEGAKAANFIERTAIHKNGTRLPIELSIAVWREDGRVQVGTIIRDLSERYAAQERVRVLTHFDRLTGLPNRVRFLERIDEALVAKQRFTVLKIGLDNIKAINGSRGMSAGDLVLQEVAKRLEALVDEKNFIARLGSDEFGLLRVGSDDPTEANVVVLRVFAALSDPVDVEGARCHVSSSVGVVLSPSLNLFAHADAVLKSCLLALQHAKDAGGRRAEVFSPNLGRKVAERHRIAEELRGALAGNQFELFYQPQVRLLDGRLTGAEALLRWNHPERGMLPPATFLEILEKSSVSGDAGQWILEDACRFASRYTAAGQPIRIGVNLFATQLEDRQLYDRVVSALKAANLDPDLLELEITETTVLGIDDPIIDPLRRLRELGVNLAFDDYGTGYASLSLLKRYPVTRLKIDREFVRDLRLDQDDAAIVKAVIALGTSMGLEIIAEGIETRAQADTLMSLGCREAQGYLFGRPMPEAEFQQKFPLTADAGERTLDRRVG